jgi:hypothetical protein
MLMLQAGDTVTLTATLGSAFANSCAFKVDADPITGCESATVLQNNTAKCSWVSTAPGVKTFTVTCGAATATPNTATVTVATPRLVVLPSKTDIRAGAATTVTARAFFNFESQGTTAEEKLVGRTVIFRVFGPASVIINSVPRQASHGDSQNSSTADVVTEFALQTDASDGTAQFTLRGTEPGTVFITSRLETGSVFTAGTAATITVTEAPPAPPSTTVTLIPILAEANTDEPVSLTATVLATATGLPLNGAKVCLFSAGQVELQYYHPHPQPHTRSLCGLTDARGKVTLDFTTRTPGTVAVAAAVLGLPGGAVTSTASHVMFWRRDHHRLYDKDRSEGWWR